MVDVDENALMVNALQREPAVAVKKSTQEAFGQWAMALREMFTMETVPA
jgi:hypothetical protein